jgi:hypothetical protein
VERIEYGDPIRPLTAASPSIVNDRARSVAAARAMAG